MSYTASKTFVVVFCSIFMVVGGVAVLGSAFVAYLDFSVGILPVLLFGTVFFCAGLFNMKSQLKQLNLFSTMTYERYKDDHPEHSQGNQLRCFACGNGRIHARGLMKHTYHREHFCTQCGKTLYYSRERG